MKDLSPEMKNLYKEYLPQYMRDLDLAFQAKDTEKFRGAAHKMASAMGNLGDTTSLEIFRKLEKENLSKEEVVKLANIAAKRVRQAILEL